MEGKIKIVFVAGKDHVAIAAGQWNNFPEYALIHAVMIV
jgi:hypothetical protein